MLLIVIMGNAFNWKFYFSEHKNLKVNTEKKIHHWNCFGKKKERILVPPVCDELFPKVIESIIESVVAEPELIVKLEPVFTEPELIVKLESVLAEPELIVKLEPVVTEVVDLFFLDVITLAELELVVESIVESVVELELK